MHGTAKHLSGKYCTKSTLGIYPRYVNRPSDGFTTLFENDEELGKISLRKQHDIEMLYQIAPIVINYK
jgi:hypothetical protein